jgi:putrescine importer
MVLDYLLHPMISIIWCSQAAMNFLPEVHYWMWAIFFFVLFTGLNLRGIKTSALINESLAAGMAVVIAIFLIASIRCVFHHPHGDPRFFISPFYDPQTFRVGAILGGTPLAVLTYIGFDGISTVSEEVENPNRNVPPATVLTCLVIGILSALEVYAAQLVWPATKLFPDVDTAFVHVAGRPG